MRKSVLKGIVSIISASYWCGVTNGLPTRILRDDPCPTPDTSFLTTIQIEFRAGCSSVIEDLLVLESTVQTVYESLVETTFCDPFQSEILRVESFFASKRGVDSKLTINFFVDGVCQGCDPTTISLFFREEEASDPEAFALVGICDELESVQDVCLSDDRINRRPSVEEFLPVFAAAIEALGDSLLCITSVFDVDLPTDAPTLSPTIETNCTINLATPLSSAIILEYNTTELSVTEVENSIQQVYNVLIDRTYDSCQSEYREITAVIFDSSQGNFISQQTNRVEEESEIVQAKFVVLGGCDRCEVGSLFFEPDVLSEDDFLAGYPAETNITFQFFKEVSEIDCPTDFSSFDDLVIVEYVGDCLSLIDDPVLVARLEAAFVNSYNDLVRDYCDPFARNLQSASIVAFGESNSLGNFPVEIRVEGTCSNCDGLNIGIYDIPTSISEARRQLQHHTLTGRALQEVCFCPVNEIGDRAPFEAEFIAAYRAKIEDLGLGCIESVGDCFFGTGFGTGVVVEFQGTIEDLTTEVLDDIERAFLLSTNQEFENNDLECNPQFRFVEQVQASILSEEISRKLQKSRQLQVSISTPPPSASPAPSSSPAPSLQPSQTQMPSQSLAPSLSDIQIDIDTVDVFLFVTGVCNQCSNDLTVSNQVSGRNLLLDIPGRLLQQDQQARSNCFCQLGALIEDLPPPPEELTGRFQERLEEEGVNIGVRGLQEVNVADCDEPVIQFKTSLRYSVTLDSRTRRDEVVAVDGFLKDTYNNLAESYCDPLERRIRDIKVEKFESRDEGQGCSTFMVVFGIDGTCRGCRDETPLFANEEIQRRLPKRDILQSNLSRSQAAAKHGSSHRRWLQVDEECVCQGQTVADRAPTRSEYDDLLLENLVSVGIPFDCEPRNEPADDLINGPGQDPNEGPGLPGPGDGPIEGPGLPGPGDEPIEGPGDEPIEGPGDEPLEGPGLPGPGGQLDPPPRA